MVSSMKDAQSKKSTLSRLGRIEGQVRGVSRMIDEERYCIDVLTQIRAIQAALNKVEQEILSIVVGHANPAAVAVVEGERDSRDRDLSDSILCPQNRCRFAHTLRPQYGPQNRK